MVREIIIYPIFVNNVTICSSIPRKEKAALSYNYVSKLLDKSPLMYSSIADTSQRCHFKSSTAKKATSMIILFVRKQVWYIQNQEGWMTFRTCSYLCSLLPSFLSRSCSLVFHLRSSFLPRLFFLL